ncbi:MAG TPA: 3-deoxy-7-phosphoheptulonate synthase [candidate division Zixibacteria bacterium]|nr:3-deoxy-7-phosphoheptulonate synthase [candidate division Zixibacteria bacterium]
MLIVMETKASPEMVEKVCKVVESMGLRAHPIPGAQRVAIGVTGNKAQVDSDKILAQRGVKDIIHVTQPFKLVSREFYPNDSVIDVKGVKVGGEEFVVMAGPCSVESREQCMTIAEQVAKLGAKIFRGGAYKPRTSPYSFQGLKEEGLKILAEVRDRYGLAIVTEAIDTETIDMVADYADLIQIGARNMQNYSLLKRAGRTQKPVLLKRGMSATLDEFLMAAEYIMAEDNPNVILCERGVRTFADHTRNTLDLSSIPFVKNASHLPIISDPSHGTGRQDKILPLSRASIAVGADGLLVEVHHDPANALSDGPQSITPEMFDELMGQMRALAPVVGRTCQ